MSRRSVSLGLALLFLVSLLPLVPSAAADHPGSNLGMLRYLQDPAYADVAIDGLVHHWPDIDITFGRWDATYPEVVDRMTIGKTSSGFDLYGVIVTDESIAFDEADTPEGTKYRIYLDGGHHGNEYLGVELVMYYLERILDEYANGDEARAEFLQTHEIHAVPMINVDGNSADTRKNSRQVDPNRNYPYEWGGPGSGDNPTSLSYRGPSPLSEAETAANAAYAESIMPDMWITMHTGVAEFYWPWGWTFDKSPDYVMFESIEEPFEAATNGEVDAMVAAELYLAAGATDDFGYGALGIPTFTYEVHDDQFIPLYGQPIPQVIENQLNGLEFMVQNTKHLGARLTLDVVAPGDSHLSLDQDMLIGTLSERVPSVVVQNIGWGNATNVSLTLTHADGSETITVIDQPDGTLGNGHAWGMALPADVVSAELTYMPLYIESAQARTLTMLLDQVELEPVEEFELPAPSTVLVAMLLAGLIALTRRRSA